jgi:hypothetical protein
VFRDFPTFSRICIFFLLIFSLLTLLTSAFQLSIFSEVSLLNFLRLPDELVEGLNGRGASALIPTSGAKWTKPSKPASK